MTVTKAWHFTGPKLRDGRDLPPDGEWLVHVGPVEMCVSGLHASRRIIDALPYAPSTTVCRVSCRQIAEERKNDKLVCRERRIDWRIEDASHILRALARKAALSHVDTWKAPDVVREYLETGDDSSREPAFFAAWDAAQYHAQKSKMCAAADVAAKATSDDTTLDVVLYTIKASVWAACIAAVEGNTSRETAWLVARDEKLNELNTLLEQMLKEEHKRRKENEQ